MMLLWNTQYHIKYIWARNFLKLFILAKLTQKKAFE